MQLMGENAVGRCARTPITKVWITAPPDPVPTRPVDQSPNFFFTKKPPVVSELRSAEFEVGGDDSGLYMWSLNGGNWTVEEGTRVLSFAAGLLRRDGLPNTLEVEPINDREPKVLLKYTWTAGSAAASGSSARRFTDLAEGNHTLLFAAIDRAGTWTKLLFVLTGSPTPHPPRCAAL